MGGAPALRHYEFNWITPGKVAHITRAYPAAATQGFTPPPQGAGESLPHFYVIWDTGQETEQHSGNVVLREEAQAHPNNFPGFMDVADVLMWIGYMYSLGNGALGTGGETMWWCTSGGCIGLIGAVGGGDDELNQI